MSNTAIFLAACLLVAIPLQAQDPVPSQVQTPAPNAAGDGNVVVPSLKGLIFIAGKDNFNAAGISTPGVLTSTVPILDSEEFREPLEQRLNQPLTMSGLNEITRSVVAFYRIHNHPLVDATAPAQNVESGVIQIVVTEFHVGNVSVRGNKWFSDSIVSAPLAFQRGDAVDSARLINQLDAANTNPFRRVNLVYQPSKDAGYTDLVLETQDRVPVRVFTGFDNGGTPATGRNRWEFGVTWGNAFWHDQQLSYNFSTSTNLFSHASYEGHSVMWSMPVFRRDSISILGGYQRSVPNIGPDFGMLGVSGQAGFRYNHSLRRTSALIHTLQFGYDFKTTNNNLAFGGLEIAKNSAEINQFPITYAANLTDRWGSSALTTSVVLSPGRWTPDNNDQAFRPASGQGGRALAEARYTYWRSDVTRLTKLPQDFVWAARVVGQISSANLLYTEQLAAGGVELLRGYDPNSLLGDRGVVISNELRTRSFHNSEETWWGSVQILGFWDWAHLSSVHDAVGEINHLNASSVGPGLRYNIRSNLTGRFDYGWQLQHLPGANDRNQLVNFSIILAY